MGREKLDFRNHLPVPNSAEALTPDWFTSALGMDDCRVEAVELDRFVAGATSKAFLRLRYSQPGRPDLPASVCVKGNLETESSPYSVSHVTEARFFRDIAPALDIPLPRSFHADEDGERGIVVFEDLAAAGAQFPIASTAWAPADVAKILELLARLHSATWGTRAGNPWWLEVGSTALRRGGEALFTPEAWSGGMDRHRLRKLLPESLHEVTGVRAANSLLQKHDDASQAHVLCHGDAHPGQVYVTPEGTRALLDWQTVSLAPWAKDVSYFLGGALSVPDRRDHERDLLRGYLDALVRCGGPAIPYDQAWTDYRRQSLQGLVWLVVTDAMQDPAVVEVMVERYATAVADLTPLHLPGG